VQVAVGEDHEAAVPRLGVLAGLLLADKRLLVLRFGLKDVIAVLKVPEFSRFEKSASSAGSSSSVEHNTVFFGLSWGFFGLSGGDTHFQTGRFEVLSKRLNYGISDRR
jgi:hypothetical protein